jgi:hypothetical protein
MIHRADAKPFHTRRGSNPPHIHVAAATIHRASALPPIQPDASMLSHSTPPVALIHHASTSPLLRIGHSVQNALVLLKMAEGLL